MARKAVERELTKEVIMNAAGKLFVEHGFRHISMRQIANELGYSHGSLYYHFKNKADLFYSLVDRNYAQLEEKMDEILRLETAEDEILRAMFLAFVEYGVSHQHDYEIMFIIRNEEFHPSLQEKPNRIYEKFAQAVFRLTGRQVTVSQVWSVFLSLHGFVSHYVRSGQTYEEVKTLAESHADNLLKMLC
jgi:AcrR family transcriptional regulator